MNTKNSGWQTEAMSKAYLEGVRGAIPLADKQLEVMLAIIRFFCPDPKSMIDLGCGDGVLGRAVLDRFPDIHAIFIDFSDSMLEAARQKIQTTDSVKIVKADYSTPDWLMSFDQADRSSRHDHAAQQAQLHGHAGQDNHPDQTAHPDQPGQTRARRKFDLIVSGFSIHHQPDTRKRELYAEIFNLLTPGGLFLNLEHVSPATEATESLFDEYFIDHLFTYHRLLDKTITRERTAEMYHGRPNKEVNILAPVELQCEWLRQIGFRDVDCFFKIFELALFGGRKEAA
ncbi:MAG: methyltransferase [bacterium]